MYGRLTVIINTVGTDIDPVPVEYFSLRQVFGLVTVERCRFVQIDALDLIASGALRNRIINHGCGVVGRAFPFYLIAEREGTNGAYIRDNGQDQLVDTIFSGARLILVVIMTCTRCAAQVVFTAPTEIIAFANGLCLYEMIIRLIFGQHQTPDLTTTGRGIRTLVLIRAGIREGLRLLVTVGVPISPRVPRATQTGIRLIDLLRVLGDMNRDGGVAT